MLRAEIDALSARLAAVEMGYVIGLGTLSVVTEYRGDTQGITGISCIFSHLDKPL